MASCKECLHYEVCVRRITSVSLDPMRCGYKCPEFKNKDELQAAKEEINKLTYKVNRLKKYDEERDIRLHARLTEEARTEAVKEFADRLKQRFESGSTYSGGLLFANIDNLVKEMVGDENA